MAITSACRRKGQVDKTLLINAIATATVAVAGLVIAGLLGLGISRPLNSMREAMNVLASGDKTVEVPGVNRRDEVGDMARTVGIFKDSLIEAERQEEENRLERQAARDAETKRREKEREVERQENSKTQREAAERGCAVKTDGRNDRSL